MSLLFSECSYFCNQHVLIVCSPLQLLNVGSLRRAPPRKIIMNVSVNDDVQLKKAENAWKPGLKRETAVEDPEVVKTQVGVQFTLCKFVSDFSLPNTLELFSGQIYASHSVLSCLCLQIGLQVHWIGSEIHCYRWMDEMKASSSWHINT